jgi:hypothetical protein
MSGLVTTVCRVCFSFGILLFFFTLSTFALIYSKLIRGEPSIWLGNRLQENDIYGAIAAVSA